MMRQKRTVSAVLCLLLLTACGKSEEKIAEANIESQSGVVLPKVSGSKAASYEISLLNTPDGIVLSGRPTAVFGIFSSSFLAQGAFLRSTSATVGVDAQIQLLAGQINVETSETFALLKEFGAVLQVDIVDALNRSSDRGKTLDAYLSSLKNITELVERKVRELDSVRDKLEDDRREENRRIRDIEKNIKNALREENYEQAGADQEELTKLKTKVATLETEIDQNKDIVGRYEKLIDIAKERYNALSVNRRIVMSGLKVVDVPGIDDFNILDENTRFGRSENPFDVGSDPLRFGSQQ